MEADEENLEDNVDRKETPTSDELTQAQNLPHIPLEEEEDKSLQYCYNEKDHEIKQNEKALEDGNLVTVKSPRVKEYVAKKKDNKDSGYLIREGTSEDMGGQYKETDVSEKHMKRRESSIATPYFQMQEMKIKPSEDPSRKADNKSRRTKQYGNRKGSYNQERAFSKNNLKTPKCSQYNKPAQFLDCPVCQEQLVNAVETDCGHAFCSECLEGARKKFKNTCPVCWRQIKFVQPSYILRDLIAKYGGEGGGPSRLKAELSHLSGDYDAPNNDDPVVVTAQFRPAHPGGCCACITGGAFDPADLYTIGGLEEFISVEEFLGTIKMVNQILSGWMPGSLKTCLGRSICWW